MSNSADRMIGHLRQQVNDLKNLEQEAGDACRKLQKTISELMEGVQKATHGSEVGSKQCIIALQSALSKCYTAANLLSTSTRPWSFPPRQNPLWTQARPRRPRRRGGSPPP